MGRMALLQSRSPRTPLFKRVLAVHSVVVVHRRLGPGGLCVPDQAPQQDSHFKNKTKILWVEALAAKADSLPACLGSPWNQHLSCFLTSVCMCTHPYKRNVGQKGQHPVLLKQWGENCHSLWCLLTWEGAGCLLLSQCLISPILCLPL